MNCINPDRVWIVRRSPLTHDGCSPCIDGSDYVPSGNEIELYNGCFTLIKGDRASRDKLIVPNPPSGELWLESDRVSSGRLRKVRQTYSGALFEVEPLPLPFDPSVGKTIKESLIYGDRETGIKKTKTSGSFSRYQPRR